MVDVEKHDKQYVDLLCKYFIKVSTESNKITKYKEDFNNWSVIKFHIYQP